MAVLADPRRGGVLELRVIQWEHVVPHSAHEPLQGHRSLERLVQLHRFRSEGARDQRTLGEPRSADLPSPTTGADHGLCRRLVTPTNLAVLEQSELQIAAEE